MNLAAIGPTVPRSGTDASATRRPRRAGLCLAGLLTVLVGCSSGGEATTTTTTTTTTVPTTAAPAVDAPPPGATATGLRDLETGECFDLIEGDEAASRAVWAVDCSTPHSYEVYDVVAYDGEGAGTGASFPDETVLQDWAEQACFDRFEQFVGIRWTLSELDISTWWPSQDSWGRGDRSAICAVVSDTGDQLTGTQAGSEG